MGIFLVTYTASFDHKISKNLTNRHPSNQFLFLEPNASDPLNKEAAEDLRSNRDGFRRNVRSAMGGGSVRAEKFDRVLI